MANALGYGGKNKASKAISNAIADHVDIVDKGVTEMMTPGGKQKVTIINESGLYSLILSSKLPSAKAFKRWVTSDILPCLRLHGAYITEETVERIMTDPNTIPTLLAEILSWHERYTAHCRHGLAQRVDGLSIRADSFI